MVVPGDKNARQNAPPAPQDEHNASPSKRQRCASPQSSGVAPGRAERPVNGGSVHRVLDVETLLRDLLGLLDLGSLASFVEVLAFTKEWRVYLAYEALWAEMLRTYFSGNLPPIEEFEEDEQQLQEQEDGLDEEDYDLIEFDDLEADDEQQENGGEESDEQQSEADEIPSANDSDDDEEEAHEGQEQDTPSVVEAPVIVAASTAGSDAWIPGLPSEMVQALACPGLLQFLRSAEQWVQFKSSIQVVRGDIGEISSVRNQAVDGLAFPTTSFLRNPHIGAAGVVFRRAGRGLNDHVRHLDVRLDVAQVHATPGFDAGVRRLIHCVGPSGTNPHCLRELQRTYTNVLRCVQREGLQCLALTSISTGNMGIPAASASWFALCAMQRYLRSPQGVNWTATVAVVCFEADAYDAFVASKAQLLKEFNAESVRAEPPPRMW